ncbi:MAG TPA: hypothetical protein VG496_02935, partial [Myxococcales bacterium]|nr:hypothetical protein [Myxococcales bacterium]
MRWLLVVLLAAAPAFAEERKLVVVPIEGVLPRADAAVLEEAVRSEARVLGVPVSSDTAASITAAKDEGAAYAVTGKSNRLEGALAIMLSVVNTADGARLASERLVGFTLADLQGDARKKIPRLLRTGLGLDPPPAAPAPAPSPATAPPPAAAPPAPTPKSPSSPSAGANPNRSAPVVAKPAIATSALPPLPPPSRPARQAPRTPAATHVSGIEEASPLVRTIRKVVEEVEDVRGLWRKTTLQAVILDTEQFSKALREKASKELAANVVAAERARWIAFGLAPADADPAKILSSVLDEQVAGFYDPSTKALTVRENPPASVGAAADAFELVLAHEVEHALQDQHFGFPDLAKLPDDDAREARLALYEGDAMATMIAVAARRAGRPVKLAISSAATAMRGMSAAELAQSAGYSTEMAQAPLVVREELIFPYVAGLGLGAEVQRRGGFALVDKMFAHPPQTTHQVLHPDAYLAGELPASVPYPAAPAGTQVLVKGRMGELGARIALQVCVDEQVAREFAQHWAGDAYTIVRASPENVALVWSTTWSGDGAKQFANLLGMQSSCWEEAARNRLENASYITALAQVRVDGSRVALARGLSATALSAAATNASRFDARVAPAAAPPLGSVNDDAGAMPARVADGRFVSTRLRIEGDIPIGFDADVEQPRTEIVVR